MLNKFHSQFKEKYIQLLKFSFLLFSKPKLHNLEYKNILFLRRDGIGDAVMFLPSFKAIKKKFPQAEIDLVNFKSFDEVLSKEKEVNIIKRPFIYFILCFLNKRKFDQMVIFSGGKEFKLLKYFEKYRNIEIVTNTSIYHEENNIDFYFRLSETIFGKLPKIEKNSSLIITDSEKKAAENLLSKIKGHEHKKIGIVVGSICWWKNYSYWEVLIQSILSDTKLKDCKIILFGGSNGISEAFNLCSKFQNIVNFTKLNLREAMSVASYMDLIICTDSGFMHISNALGIGTIAMFGATWPYRLMRRDKKNRIIAISLSLECSPCYRPGNEFLCSNDLKCMRIPVETLVANVKNVISGEVDYEQPALIN